MNDQVGGIPSISADGATVSGPCPESGLLMAQRHGGLGALYGRPAQEVLDASTPLPTRLLLSYAVQTRKNRRDGALAAALGTGMIGLLPVVIAWSVLSAMHVRDRVVLCLPPLVLAVTMIYVFFREVRLPKNAWQRTLWLDFENRELRLRYALFDEGHAPATDRVPFTDLALVCFPYPWEQETTFDIGLCCKDQLKRDGSTDPPCLCMIHSSDDEGATLQTGIALATAWGLECRARVGNQWAAVAVASIQRAAL